MYEADIKNLNSPGYNLDAMKIKFSSSPKLLGSIQIAQRNQAFIQ